jgi:Zn finger protein HypA/HybF involved in hydrogenase expression
MKRKYKKEDLYSYGIEILQERGDEALVHCIFNNCDNDSIGREAHLSINFKKGVYYCYKCGSKGHISELFKYLNSYNHRNG